MFAFPFAHHACRLRADNRGAVSATMGILLIPLVGFLAVGFEISNWYLLTRGMQNAADSAAITAAINNGANYDVEAKAVAAKYGFINGTNNVTVVVTNTATCPGGGNTCYSATIAGYTPLLLSQVVGYKGDATINGALQKHLDAVAVAKAATKPEDLCLVALASSGTSPAISTNGAPTGDMNGCNSMSNTAARCTGHNLGLGISFAIGSNNGCGNQQVTVNQKLADPYQYLWNQNMQGLGSPSSYCTGLPPYPQETVKGNKVSGGTTLSTTGSLDLLPGNNVVCGDQVLAKNTTITCSACLTGQSPVLVIENGALELNGFTLTSSSLTIVFTGDPTSYQHAPIDSTNGSGSGLDIAGPTSGPWQGIAIYQDPVLTSGVSVSAAGNSPTWDISGLIYMPHASLTLKGAIDKANSGKSCVVLVADNFQISGTGGIMKSDTQGCGGYLKMPTENIPGGAQLVL